MVTRKRATRTPVEAVSHADTRLNIPTEELREFVPDEVAPETPLYPRDPSLDPQLVWKGKDEQDREALRGAGFDVLVVCGFAFDAHAGETAKEFSPSPPTPLPPERARGAYSGDEPQPSLRYGETDRSADAQGHSRLPSPAPAGEGSGVRAATSRAGFVAEETRQYGKLPVLLTRMNLDLAMGDDLLKKTGRGTCSWSLESRT